MAMFRRRTRNSGDARPARREPDITVLLVMIAAASIITMAELAAVVSLPIGWVFVAGLLPIAFWAILLRETYRLLRHSGEDPAASPEPVPED